ncbi:MAG: NAD(P)-dependent oxidoreductase, partial [Verrucomicrobiota bacterium]
MSFVYHDRVYQHDGPRLFSYLDEYGFLAPEPASTNIRIWSLDGDWLQYDRRQLNRTNESMYVSVRKENLPDVVRRYVKAFNAVPRTGSTPLDYHSEKGAIRNRLFILAWACIQRGYPEEAIALIPAMKIVFYSRKSGFGLETMPDAKAQQYIQEGVAHDRAARVIMSFDDPEQNRPELLAAFEDVLTNGPEHNLTPRIKEHAVILKSMLEEDRAYATNPPDRSSFTQQEKIADLIYQLRDQTGAQWLQPGFVNIFEDREGRTNTPAHQLLRYDLKAVPQMIDALNDRRLTRAVTYQSSFRFSDTILRVGDCAYLLLCSIAGRTFYEPEPLPEDHPLWDMPNVLITPHVAVADADNIP